MCKEKKKQYVWAFSFIVLALYFDYFHKNDNRLIWYVIWANDKSIQVWMQHHQNILMVCDYNYSNHLNTGLVWYSNGQFVSGSQMVVWKPDWKSLFIIQSVQYLNGLPSHKTLPFEYRIPILSGIQMIPEYRCSVFRWLLFK